VLYFLRRNFHAPSFLALFLSSIACCAQREPVLKQIDLPHSYYYREMYLPQLTTGPSAAAWFARLAISRLLDGRIIVAPGARQPEGEQLTSGPGYDYQPDWSSDGRWIVFCPL